MPNELLFTDGDTLTGEPEVTQLATIETPNPMTLLAKAVESGIGTQELETLVGLQERWENREAEKAFAVAMHAAQKEMPNVVRDGENTHTKKKYALLESIQKRCKPIYEKHGFSLSYGEADCPTDKQKRTVCDVTHIGGNSRRYHLDLPVDSSGSMNPIQGCVSTTSYAQRRLLCMIFNITIGGEDDDGATAELCSEQEIKTLETLIKKTGTDGPTFLQWAGVESLDLFPRRKFKDAVQMLNKKASRNGSF